MKEIEFKDIKWLNEYLGIELHSSKIISGLTFSLMWSLFENKVCNTNFNLNDVKNEIEIHGIAPDIFQDEINFFKLKKQNYSGDYYQYGLTLPNNNQFRQLVIDLLEENPQNDEDKICGLIYIIFRLRNNLFHGNKEITNMEYNEDNFENSNSVIQKFLEKIK